MLPSPAVSESIPHHAETSCPHWIVDECRCGCDFDTLSKALRQAASDVVLARLEHIEALSLSSKRALDSARRRQLFFSQLLSKYHPGMSARSLLTGDGSHEAT